ncbi:hypothetical protein CPLU01_10435 [Colletotrichum plurivorum]|uniref:Uncharacterized protein n=1 Tax=Colletotrichum plurivorum TaxID=2175906 RepID=A0A8H6K4Z1_9PEZI|nr:hypothetical protein CPLU01_10435 [Colletotrichum plurivorum]
MAFKPETKRRRRAAKIPSSGPEADSDPAGPAWTPQASQRRMSRRHDGGGIMVPRHEILDDSCFVRVTYPQGTSSRDWPTLPLGGAHLSLGRRYASVFTQLTSNGAQARPARHYDQPSAHIELMDNQCQRAPVPAEDPLQALCLEHRLLYTLVYTYANDDNEGLDNDTILP